MQTARSTYTPATPAPRRDRLRDVHAGDRWLVVVAHPDDETFGCGSLIAHAASLGAHVEVLCATRGEAGEATGSIPCGTDLGAVREHELRNAARLLGAATVSLLDHRDSGFDGDPPPGSLCAATVVEVTGQIAARLDDTSPHVVITLDGSDGHRDHVRIRNCVHDAVAALDTDDPELFEHCLPNALMRRWIHETRARRPDSAYHALDAARVGRPDDEITDSVDVSHLLALRQAAIDIHRSQSSPFAGLSAELRTAFLATDHLARVPRR